MASPKTEAAHFFRYDGHVKRVIIVAGYVIVILPNGDRWLAAFSDPQITKDSPT